MIRPRTRPMLAAGTVALFLLTACGGEDDSPKANDKISGAATGEETSASPTGSSAGGAERPEISLPSDLTYSFEWSKTGDKDKDAVLSDSRQFIEAVDMAIAEQDPLHAAYRFYSEGEAAASSQKFIQEFVDYSDRITGTKRFYDAKVQIDDDGTAGFVYCEDQNKAYNKSLKTGKTSVTPESDDNYVLYNSRLRVNKQGVWVTEKLTSERGNAACRP
ncbi:hypothetical protein ABZZ79_20150 [Streptomyces sp. NPDC006458]|uniref:hypothetical protein n=1 Tax=Streptomyces sp. NPDC006458 TaxID=3154302 RepID=UPI0033A8F3D2